MVDALQSLSIFVLAVGLLVLSNRQQTAQFWQERMERVIRTHLDELRRIIRKGNWDQ